MKFEMDFAPRVSREVASIYQYREENLGQGSGERFLKALNACYDSIQANPFGFQIRQDPFRHAMLHRLRYRVVFKVEGQLISVVQVRHTSRRPSTTFGP